jgi:hypothetical protein
MKTSGYTRVYCTSLGDKTMESIYRHRENEAMQLVISIALTIVNNFFVIDIIFAYQLQMMLPVTASIC